MGSYGTMRKWCPLVMPKSGQRACVEPQDVEKEVKEVDSSGKTKKRKVRDVEYCYEAELEGESPSASNPPFSST
jgi:hypothetical protein